MSVAEQLAWIAARREDAPARSAALAAAVTTDPRARREVAADILRGLTTDYASDLRALVDQINKEPNQ